MNNCKECGFELSIQPCPICKGRRSHKDMVDQFKGSPNELMKAMGLIPPSDGQSKPEPEKPGVWAVYNASINGQLIYQTEIEALRAIAAMVKATPKFVPFGESI